MLTSANYQHLGFEPGAQLIDAFYLEVPYFGFHWHYHPELEITCVRNGRGTRLVGDHVSTFGPGDCVLMGSNLPHTWISDDDFNHSDEMMEVVVLQFHPAIFEGPLWQSQGMERIRYLLAHVERGIEIQPQIRTQVAECLFRMVEVKGFERIPLFFSLMHLLGQQETFTLLASQAYIPPLNDVAEKRILDVCRYVHDHFMSPIRLDAVAQIANMNPTSFCRFFRKSTGQSLSEYVNDLRIGKACNLLLDRRELSISEIAFMSGFPSQTLFNRIFLKKKGMTPSGFKRVLRGE